jgi:hypothetical protein
LLAGAASIICNASFPDTNGGNHSRELVSRGVYRLEITAQRLQRVPLPINFVCGAETHAAENWDGWTPTLNGVLKQKSRDEGG